MGLFGLFEKREPEAKDRCNECGMTGGRHTDWCPAATTDSDDVERPPSGASPPEATEGVARPRP